MKTANNNSGRSAYCVGTDQNKRRISEGKPGSAPNIGPAAGLAICLAVGLMLSAPAASAQQAYAMEFDQSDNLFGTINLLNGDFTELGDEGSTLFNDIAAAPDGTLYGIVNETSLVTVNVANGGISSTESLSPDGIESMAFAPNGTLYGASQNALYTINPLTGVATLVGDFGNNSPLTGYGQNIRFAANGELYDTDGGVDAQNTDLFQINLATGAASLAGEIVGFPGLCLENSGQVMYGVGIQLGAASTVVQDLVGIDLGSIEPGGTNADGSIGTLSYTEVTGDFPNNYNFTASGDYTVPGMPVTPAPEPGVLGSFVAGTMLLLVFHQRRWK
ncbi:MAG TPA: hypothetical protein VL970_09350 [Candidatus Acidoferrales bacterium]|nr:hypothetical protein [Candidatus Acidoferrales bacterium]